MSISTPDVTVSIDDVRALVAGPRLHILRILIDRPMTVTELAKAFGVPKSTMHGHLHALVDAGLVARREDDRVWIYYSVTEKGNAIGKSGHVRVILLWSSVVSVALLTALVNFLGANRGQDSSQSWEVEPIGVPSDTSYAGIVVVVLAALTVALSVLAVIATRKYLNTKRGVAQAFS